MQAARRRGQRFLHQTSMTKVRGGRREEGGRRREEGGGRREEGGGRREEGGGRREEGGGRGEEGGGRREEGGVQQNCVLRCSRSSHESCGLEGA